MLQSLITNTVYPGVPYVITNLGGMQSKNKINPEQQHCITPLADPGFGQGGGPRNFFRDFADVAKWSRASEAS